MAKGKPMSLEHKAKLKAGREKYLAERQAFPPSGGTITPTVLKEKYVPNNARTPHRDYAVNKIALRRQQLIDSQLDVAIGYSYVTEDGTKIYTKAPNASTGEYLLNQLIGKPKESIEVKEVIRLSVDI